MDARQKMLRGSGMLALAVAALLCACALAASPAQSAYAGTLVATQGASGLAKGDTFTVNGNKYRVDEIEHDGNDLSEAVLVKYGSTSKKPKINTVTYKGETFEVEAIGKNAFNNKAGHKITSVTIGRNVDNIGAKAFYGCKKLKSLNMAKADVIDIEKEHGSYVIDDIDIGAKAFSKAGVKSVKVKCGKSGSSYRALYKKALVKKGMRGSVSVVK